MWRGSGSRSRRPQRTTLTKIRLPPNCKQACQTMRPLSTKWNMHRSQYERSSECLHVRHRSVVLCGVRDRFQADYRQRSPWDEQARVSNVSAAGHGPHRFRTRNDRSTAQRTRSKSNENTEKTTELIDFPPLITLWLQVRVLPGPSADQWLSRVF